jgi:endoglycosylceramidase
MRRSLVAALVGLTAAAGPAATDAACDSVITVNPSTGHYVDTCGRTRFFRGANVVYKGTPWHPLTGADEFDPVLSFNQVDAQLWQSLGHNLMRLGTMWPGVVPSRDQVNSTYLDVMTNLTAMASSFGIFSLLDFHQDTFSTKFCGEGESI